MRAVVQTRPSGKRLTPSLQQLIMPAHITQRSRRIQLDTEARLITGDGVKLHVIVLDLSHSGLRLKCPEDLFPGEIVEIRLGRSGYVRAKILWCRGDEAGGAFLL